MKRFLILIFVLSLVAAACSGESVEQPVDTAAVDTSTSVVQESGSDTTTTTAAASSSTSTASESRTPRAEGPEAPDFTLALETGGKFSLGQEVKPVYLVFWAEW